MRFSKECMFSVFKAGATFWGTILTTLPVDDADAEITYISSDKIRFRIHAINLKGRTEGLSPPEGMSYKEPVHLSEPATILRLLFQFLYPNPSGVHQPSTVFSLDSDIDFDLLKGLAEAAEKYQVFPAMYVCLLRMQ